MMKAKEVKVGRKYQISYKEIPIKITKVVDRKECDCGRPAIRIRFRYKGAENAEQVHMQDFIREIPETELEKIQKEILR